VRIPAQRGEPADQNEAVPPPKQLHVPVNGRGPVTITIQVDGQNPAGAAAGAGQEGLFMPPPDAGGLAGEEEERWRIVPPEKSDMVFVDISAYNSKHYHIEGDVLTPGRIPWTGNETVLDAVEFAAGLLPTAEPKDIRLVRPSRGGRQAQVLKVDYAAIKDKGDSTSNYQIFPGDRLVVGRNEVVKRTVEIDRVNAPLLAVTGMMMQEALLLKSLQSATASDRDQLLKEYVDFWTNVLQQKGDLKFDEQTLRKALLRKMKLVPAPTPGVP
jgi:hypothetical protein